ncbi:hypothetical protein VNI00_010944, partial [Paramarasmius palmivorus]
MSLHNCSQVTITGGVLNQVNGDQYNTSVVHVNHQMHVERTEYDEFEYVNRGRIITLKNIHTDDLSKAWEGEWKDGQFVRKPTRSTQRTICTVEVHPDRHAKYTAVFYEGKDAHIFWEEDFKRYS